MEGAWGRRGHDGSIAAQERTGSVSRETGAGAGVGAHRMDPAPYFPSTQMKTPLLDPAELRQAVPSTGIGWKTWTSVYPHTVQLTSGPGPQGSRSKS